MTIQTKNHNFFQTRSQSPRSFWTAPKTSSKIIHFPETHIWVPISGRLRADHFHRAIQFSLKKLAKEETFYVKEQQYEVYSFGQTVSI